MGKFILIVFIVVLTFFLIHLLFQKPKFHFKGGHAALMHKPEMFIKKKGDKLILRFGKIGKDVCVISTPHHFPIVYGNSLKQYVHGVPIDYISIIKRDEYELVSVYEFKEDRIVYHITAAFYNLKKHDNGDICVVMLPNAKPSESIGKSMIDFAYIDEIKVPYLINSMYKFNSLPMGPLNINATCETIAKQLNTCISMFVFPNKDKHRIDDNRLSEDRRIPLDVSFYVKKINDQWVIITKDELIPWIESFKNALVLNNYYDYIDGYLTFTENQINDSFGLMQHYSHTSNVNNISNA